VEQRTLGGSDLRITRLGLGAWAIGGGDWVYGWGPQRDADSLATIRNAVERGINWIDTAAVFGLGHAERIIARGLRDIPRRERPYVFTSCGLVWDELGNVSHSLEPQSIRREAETSLRRLEVDCIDLYQIGWPACPKSPARHDPGPLEAAWETMTALQREGKARLVGVSNCNAEQLARLQRVAPVTILHAPYSLLRREIEDQTLPFCEDHRISVIACSPLQSGLLTGKMTPERLASLPHNDWRRRSPDFHGTGLSRALGMVDRLAAIGARDGRSAGAVAIAWTLHNAAVTVTAVGARQPHQVDDIVEAASFRFAAGEIDELQQASSLAHAS
jgi:aryl-alcohol dehydrogenase-like predicted oxidoreductase